MGILKDKMKINKVSLDFSNYYFFLKGIEKSGKTTLARDLILKLYDNNPNAGLLLAVGKEKGYKALDSIQALDVETWDDFSEAVDDLVNNREEYAGIKFIFVDTLDELVELAEKETIAYSNRTTGKIVTTLNQALGGYGNGRKYLCKIVDSKLSALKQAGYGLMVIGHTKLRTVKEQGMTDEQEFQVLDSNLNSDYANIVAHKADVMATINIERIVNDTKRVVDTKRYIYFRGNGFVNAGTRFSNIVEKVELSADNFINAIEFAIRSSMNTPMSDEELENLKKAEIKDNEAKAKEFVAKCKAENSAKSSDNIKSKEEKVDKIKANLSKIAINDLQAIMTKHNILNFNDVSVIPTLALDEILALI